MTDKEKSAEALLRELFRDSISVHTTSGYYNIPADWIRRARELLYPKEPQ